MTASTLTVPAGTSATSPPTGLTPEQIQQISASWEQIRPVQLQVASLFYGRLFQLDPSLRPLFRGDLQQQGHKLMAALDFVVTGLDRWPERLPAVQALARRHTSYGVQPAHYQTVGSALVWTLMQGLGQDENSPLISAWRVAYGLVASAMQDAAWPPQASAAEWQAQAG